MNPEDLRSTRLKELPSLPVSLAPGGRLDLAPIAALTGPIGRIAALAPSRPRCSATRSSARPSSKDSESEMAGQPKRSNRVCRRAWRFTNGRGRQSSPLRASKSKTQRWMAPGLVQRTCSLAKFGRPSASLATTSPSSTAALAGSSCSSCAIEGKRSVKCDVGVRTKLMACQGSILGLLLLHQRTCRPRRSARKKCASKRLMHRSKWCH